jgi:arginine decarboxylase
VEEITAAISEAPRVDQFLMATETRFDRWRRLLQEARAWERSTNQQSPNKEKYRAALTGHFSELLQWEDYFAYPGQELLASVEERIGSGDAAGAARLIRSVGNALLTNSYRTTVAD